MFFKRISGLVFRLLILFLLGLPAVSRAARLILPVEDDFLKGSILQKGGGPTGSLLYEGLITRNTQGGYDGWLAHSWESHDNARVWRFSLVKRATWHDGVPFTAHDVKFTYDYMTEKQLWLASVLWMVEKVECPDDHTVVFRLKRSFPKFLDRLSHCPGIVIIPRHIWKSIENPMRYEDQHYIGTGPLQFVKKIPGQFFEMKPYAGYHGRHCAFSSVVLRHLNNADVQIMALKSGQIDAMDDLTPWEAAVLSKEKHIQLAVIPHKRLYELCFNCTKHPTSSPYLRQALAYAVDREKICRIVLQDQGRPATTWLMPQLASNCVHKDLFPYALDLERARSLLKAGGFRWEGNRLCDNQGNEVRLELLLGGKGKSSINSRMAEMLADGLKQLGIIVELKKADSFTWFKEARDHHLFIMAMPDLMHDDSDDLTHFQSRSFFGKPNWHGYSNPDYDRLTAELHETSDTEKRRTLAFAMQELLAAEVPSFAICEADEVIAFRSDRIAIKEASGSMYGQILDLRTLLAIEPVGMNPVNADQ